jgi:hypothetical protein
VIGSELLANRLNVVTVQLEELLEIEVREPVGKSLLADESIGVGGHGRLLKWLPGEIYDERGRPFLACEGLKKCLGTRADKGFARKAHQNCTESTITPGCRRPTFDSWLGNVAPKARLPLTANF